MKYLIAATAALTLGLCVEAMQFADVFVSGGSEPTILNLDADPAIVGIMTTSTGDSFIDLVPAQPGTQAAKINLFHLNESGVDWLGLDFELGDGAAFNAPPSLTLGGAFMSAVSGAGDELAELITPFPHTTTLFIDLDITLSRDTRITLTPIVPEPAAVAGLALLGLSRRRGRC